MIVAEVIESNRKPTRPWGCARQNSFGEIPEVVDRGEVWQTILAIGRQDTETTDLEAPPVERAPSSPFFPGDRQLI